MKTRSVMKRYRMFLPALGVASALLATASGASAMTKSQGQTNIATKAAANTWVGTPTPPAAVLPAVTGCSQAGPCAGWYESFTGWASIYTFDPSGPGNTHTVGGLILNAYNGLSAANGLLHYPITDELDTPGGRKQRFQGGTLYWKASAPAAYEVNGWIEAKWNALGATTSALGFPTSHETNWGSGKINWFEGGMVIWDGVAGSWGADAWPVLEAPSRNPTGTSNGTWITARRPMATTTEVFGCGFSPNAYVAFFTNNLTSRSFVKLQQANASGCVTTTFGAIGPSFWSNGVATIEASDGPHYAVHGLAESAPECEGTNGDFGAVSYFMAYKTDTTTYCVDPTWWKAHHQDFRAFDLAFPDDAYARLEENFGVSMQGLPFKVEVGPWKDKMGATQTGCNVAHTGTAFGAGMFLGEDCFLQLPGNSASGAYVFLAQEIVNNFTGGVAGVWPTDWWADHRSPFPTVVNWHLLDELGKTEAYNNNYVYNHGSPSPDQVGTTGTLWDPQTDMFEEIRIIKPGWTGFLTMFQALQHDGILFQDLRDPPTYTAQSTWVSGNPSELLADYVIAYMSLGHGVNLTNKAILYGVGHHPEMFVGGVLVNCWRIKGGCDPADGNVEAYWQDYTPNSVKVDAIADAHCRLAAADAQGAGGTALGTAYDNLQKGNFTLATVAGFPGVCGAGCPSECGCNHTTNRCVAPWNGN